VRLIYQRPAGNTFPDNDRDAEGGLSRAGAVVGVETTICPR